MSKRINKNGVTLLKDVAEYRMLTLSQMTVLHFGSKRSARRRMQQLVEAGYVEVLPVNGGVGFGRPESVFGISSRGCLFLQSEGILPDSVATDQVTGSSLLRQAGHQILMNWCRIHLVHLVKDFSRIQFDILASNSPFALCTGNGVPVVRDCVRLSNDDDSVWFEPDAVFALTDTERVLTIPFFLEVDMNTESLAGTNERDIRQKIIRYQQYFHSNGYKRYEKMWGVELEGFRLLFLTNSISRMNALSTIVRAMPPSDFMWITRQDKMFTEGISGNIWVCGGKDELGHKSILGTLSRPSPIANLGDK